MTYSLAVETSARTGSIALAVDGAVVAESRFEHGLRHAAELVTRIDTLCRDAGCRPIDLKEIYVSVGPGSFTGLRIGVTLGKTLAFATGASLVAVPSALALADNAPPQASHVRTVLDAKRGQVFTALLRRGGDNWEFVEEPRVDHLAAAVGRSPRPLHLTGEGLAVHGDPYRAGGIDVIVLPEDLWVADARSVVRIGYRMARAGQFTPPDLLLPLYIRIPEAQEKWEARQQCPPTVTSS